jgi:hypothetical protein
VRFKLLVIDSWPGGSLAHAVTLSTTTWAPLCGAGVDRRYDQLDEKWYGADEAHRIECADCRRLFERRAA